MGAADELQPHRRGFRAKHLGKDAIERVAAEIVVAITTHRGEVVSAHPLGLKAASTLASWGCTEAVRSAAAAVSCCWAAATASQAWGEAAGQEGSKAIGQLKASLLQQRFS